jgi:hypothetical protein
MILTEQNDSSKFKKEYKMTLYLIERQESDLCRFLIYGNIYKINPKQYLSFQTKNSEFAEDFNRGNTEATWVKLNFITKTAYFDLNEINTFLSQLRSGCFPYKEIGTIKNRQGFIVIPRPEVFQFDKDSLRCECPEFSSPESSTGELIKVESFWQKDMDGILEAALNPLPTSSEDTLTLEKDAPSIEAEFNSRLRDLSKTLKEKMGLSFDSNYAERIGNIEFFSSKSERFVIVSAKEEEGKKRVYRCHGIEIIQKEAAVKNNHFAHIVLRNGSDTIYDKMVILPKEQKTFGPYNAQENISEFKVDIFNESGDLVLSEQKSLIREICYCMMIRSGTKTTQDNLVHRLLSNKKTEDIGTRLSEASSFHPQDSIVGGYSDDPWVPMAKKMRFLVSQQSKKAKYSRWFQKGMASEGAAIEYLREIIDNTNNREVWVVDPFFGTSAFERLIPRLRNADLKLKIMTCCLGWNPDEKDSQSDNSVWNKEAKEQRNRLTSWCNKNLSLIAVNLKIIDLAKGKKQAFHDRYLICEKKCGEREVYSLSNSLNNLSGKYPCLITKVEYPVATDIYIYLAALSEETGITEKVIWDSEPSFKQSRLIDTAPPKILDEGPSEFPFVFQLLEFFFGKKDKKNLIDDAIKLGLISGSKHRWQIGNETDFLRILNDAWGKTTNSKDQSIFIAGLGEFLADSTHQKDWLVATSEIVKKSKKQFKTKETLDQLFTTYKELPYRQGFNGVSPSASVLTTSHFFEWKGSWNFELLSAAQNYFEYPRMEVSGCFGLLFALQLLFKIDPQQALDWVDQEHNQNPFIASMIIEVVVDTLQTEKENSLLDILIKSKRPFIRMFCIFRLFWKGWGRNEIDYKKLLEKAIQRMESWSIPYGDILWIVSILFSDLQVQEFNLKGKKKSDSDATNVTKEKDAYIAMEAKLFLKTSPNEKQLSYLDQGLRNNTKDRFSLAQKVDIQQKSKPLYEKCVDDVEKLIGRKLPQSDFYFYEHDDFDKLFVGAKSYVILKEETVDTTFRNRYIKYLENLAYKVSDQTEKTKDFSSWNFNAGRCAAGCLFGLFVYNEGKSRYPTKQYDVFFEHLFEITCQLQLGINFGWYDIAGLQDRLYQEASWALSFQNGNSSAILMARQAVNDVRLPLYFRGCLASVPQIIYADDSSKALELLSKFLDREGLRNASRYFYLLDFIIGNSFKTGLDQEPISQAIKNGLSTYSLSEPWASFFNNVQQALGGDQEKQKGILQNEWTAQSYCTTLFKTEGDQDGR